jgi:hypothetical protein
MIKADSHIPLRIHRGSVTFQLVSQLQNPEVKKLTVAQLIKHYYFVTTLIRGTT